MLGTILNTFLFNDFIGYAIVAILSLLIGFYSQFKDKHKFVPFRNAYGIIVGYHDANIHPNVFIQYVAAHTNYKPVFDSEGNVEGFRFQKIVTQENEAEDPTPAA